MSHTLIIATANAHKQKEMQAILGEAWKIKTLKDFPELPEIEEPYLTLEENSQHKAKVLFEKTGLDCIAEDSGLEVDALSGAPGALSARYAGAQRSDADNICLVLEQMKGNANRSARFRTVITLYTRDEIKQFEGVVAGRLTEAPIGDGGFGYDPVFIPDGYTDTFAVLSPEIKNSISHRANALAKLVTYLNYSK